MMMAPGVRASQAHFSHPGQRSSRYRSVVEVSLFIRHSALVNGTSITKKLAVGVLGREFWGSVGGVEIIAPKSGLGKEE
jgi:hypothetical protein